MCFLVIVGLIIGQYVANREVPLEGTLSGEFVASTTIKPVKVPPGDSGLTKAQLEPLVAALKQAPLRASSSLVHTEFHGVTDGLEVRMIPTPASRVVRVNPAGNEVLTNWLSANSERLAARRDSELAAAAAKFFDDYAAFVGGGSKVTLDTYYRNQLGIAAMCSGFGYATEAIAAKQQCPCVAEDAAGNLYFVVPAQARKLTLRGRTLSDGKKLFDGTFTVACDVAREQVQPAEPVAPAAEPKDSNANAESPGSSAPDEPAATKPDQKQPTGAKSGDMTSPGMMESSSPGMMKMDG